ncbi:MAG: MFS transporter [Saprospiraceae bacterium]|nr:MFS transporter [Saprospiraceae bacterium]MCB9326226.1 MFS transporter [Lewinellaceae bacterium]
MNTNVTKLPAIELNNRRTINGWAFFDWANSAFALVITVAIFPTYFTEVTAAEVKFLGFEMSNNALYAYSISAAYILIAILSPILSGIADYGGKKMVFMRFFTIIGSLACISLFWFRDTSQVYIGVLGFVLGMVGFAGGQVFYNSYLPQIASEDQYDRVSARGFTFGYVGSVILLIVNLLMIQKPEWFGIHNTGTTAVRISFIMVGLWWIGFAIIPFSRLPRDKKNKNKGLITRGFRELVKVWKFIQQQRQIKIFLAAFFCYNAGVQTVLYLASLFAKQELHFETSELIIVVLILQIVAIGGAYIFAKLSDAKGNKFSIMVMLVIWIVICFLAYIVSGKLDFYALAAGVGIVMGGIQSLSRSTYAKLLPEDLKDTASFFSFYEVVDKISIILGTFSFGLITNITGNMRMSVLVLGVYFLLGLVILRYVKIEHATGLVEEVEV